MGSVANLQEFFFLRHGARLDQADFHWRNTAATPYDSPLTANGALQAALTGQAIAQHAQGTRFVIHCSPFLRCIQTSLALASALPSVPLLRLDTFLGEWMTPDYYKDIAAPPPMDALASAARAGLQAFRRNPVTGSGALGAGFPYDPSRVTLDDTWDMQQFGAGGEYGEEWPEMHDRFRHGLAHLIDYYNRSDAAHEPRTVVILVTHGAGCNAMLGAVSGRPVLKDVGLCALSHAIANDRLDPTASTEGPSTPTALYTTFKGSTKLSRRFFLLMVADVSHLQRTTISSSSSTPNLPFKQSSMGRSMSVNMQRPSISQTPRPSSPSQGLWQSKDVLEENLAEAVPVLYTKLARHVPSPPPVFSPAARRSVQPRRQRSYSVVI